MRTSAKAPTPAEPKNQAAPHLSGSPSANWHRTTWVLPTLSLICAGAVAAGVLCYALIERRQIKRQQEDQLSAIADLKRDELINWRNERLTDARFFSRAPFAAKDVQSFLAQPDSEPARKSLLIWMNLLKGGDRYMQVALFDSHGNARLSVPADPIEDSPLLRAQLREALHSREPIFGDITQSPDPSRLHLDILAPVFPPPDTAPAGAAPMAAILLRIDPRQFLFRMLKSWPVPSESAEILLLRHEGDKVVFLNEPRTQPGLAGPHHIPFSQLELPADALRREGEEMNEGRDYRGAQVLRVHRRIPGTAWVMGAKIDTAEAFASLQSQTIYLSALGLALSLGAISALKWLWRKREVSFLREELATKHQLDQNRLRLEGLVSSAMDGIITVDDHELIVGFNPAAERIFGRSTESMLGQRLDALLPERFRGSHAQQHRDFMATGATSRQMGGVRTVVGLRANGEEFPIEASLSRVVTAGGVYSMVILRDITARKKAEESISLFRALWDRSNDAFEVVDGETARFLDANECAYAELGYSREEFLDRRVWEINPAIKEEDWPEILASLHQAKSRVMDGEHRRKDGSTFPVEVKVHLVELDRDYLVTAVRDMTERRRFETRLRQLSTVVEQCPTSIVITDLAGAIEYVNPTFAALTGYSPAEVIGRNPRMLKAGNQPAEYYRRLWSEISAGRTWHGEFLNVKKSGESYWEWATIAPIFDPDRRITHFVALKEDITERKRLEAEAQRQELRFRALIENGSDLITVIDSVGVIRYQSPSVSRILGYRPEDMVGHNAFELIHPDDVERVSAAIQGVLAEPGKTGTVEYLVRRQEGSWCTLQSIGAYHPDQPLNPIVVSSRDVTGERLLEAQFRQAQKMEAIGRLAGGVAHDFNNLLSVIIGHTGLLAALLSGDANVRESIAEIEQAAQRAAALTKQLLLFSRQHVVEPQIVSLNEVIAGSERMLRRLIGEDIILLTTLAADLESVKIDPGQMNQVIMNMAVNARDAMPKGGRLTLATKNLALDASFTHTHPELQPGPYILLTVADTGCGMSRELQSRIFEPFFTTKGLGQGTGLGLSVVQGIIKSSGGSIAVESEPGHGTIFKIYLPAVHTARPSPLVPSLDQTLPRGAETILLAEDEAPLRKLTALTLERLGYTVYKAESGEEALKLAAEHGEAIDLLVTDVVMPGMSGRELADALHAQRPDLRVLYLSGYTDDAVVRNGVRQAEVSFLQKPFRLNALAAKLREALDQPKRPMRASAPDDARPSAES